jgi:ribonuclease BN (tRNA processing enzyme)
MRNGAPQGRGIEITFLGTGDAFASGGRFQSGYLVDTPNLRILMEAGPTALSALKRLEIRPSEIDLVLISHLHGDHFGGLPFLILDWLWEQPPRRTVTIAGPPKLKERTWRLFHTMFPYSRADIVGLQRKLKFVAVGPNDKRRISGIRVEAIRTPHMQREPSLAFKLGINGKTIAFSGDSGWTDDLIGFTAGADVFLCECTYFDSAHLAFHMNYPQLAAQRERFDVRRMILTHVGREVLNREGEVRLETATDGMKIQV